MTTVSVSTVAIRHLVSRMATATDASIFAVRDKLIKSAEQLVGAIGGSWITTIWDPEGPERKQQQKNLQEAIDKVKKAKTTEDVKRSLVYLQSTIDVTKTFYPQNSSFARALQVFLDDVSKAPALLVDKVVSPVVKTAATIGGKTIWATVKGMWPILLLALGLVIVYSVSVRRLSA